MPDTIPLSDLAMAAFCPRKLYYARTRDRQPPPAHATAREIAGQYANLHTTPETITRFDLPIGPDTFETNLLETKQRIEAWPAIVDPTATDVFLQGKDVHGLAAKVLEDPLAPTLLSPGEPPAEGVWEPQTVRAVGLAKALSWEREETIELAFVEYPRYGVIRRVDLTTRRKAAYRRTLRTARAIDGPPPRSGNDAKCQTCEFAAECGAKTRSLRSLL